MAMAGSVQLSAMFSSGRAIDLVLLFMVVEFVVLYRRRRDRRKAPVDLILALAPGACLLLAVRAALTGAGWIWVAAFIAASLPAHLADMSRRRI
jgi:hypothetical protein